MTSQGDIGRPADTGDLLAHVRDHRDLARVVEAMRTDLAERPHEWENGTLQRYLGALAAVVDSVDNLLSNRDEDLPEQPSWALVAELLVAASGYE